MATLTLAELAARTGAELRGTEDCLVTRVAPLARAGSDAVAFLANPRLRHLLASTAAAAVILAPTEATGYAGNALLAENPYLVYAKVADLLHPVVRPPPGIHPSASVASSVRIGEGVSVGPQCVVEDDVTIGAGTVVGPACILASGTRLGCDCRLVARVTVCWGCNLGDRVVVHPGVVIGADGFGLVRDGEAWVKVPQVGRVRIGNDVEIGANTTIDRGAIEDTEVGDGVKMDNLIQVAHNVKIGAHTAIAACTGIAGSAIIGARCTLGGSVGILGHLQIVDDVHITARSLVTKSISQAGTYSSGTPLERNDRWHRNYVRFKQLDDMARRLRALERRLDDDNSSS